MRDLHGSLPQGWRMEPGGDREQESEVDEEAFKSDPSLRKAAVVAATVGKLIEVLPGLQARANAPDVSALLIQRDLAKAELDHVEAKVALALRTVTLADALLAAMYREMDQLWKSREELCLALTTGTSDACRTTVAGKVLKGDSGAVHFLAGSNGNYELLAYLTDRSKGEARKRLFNAVAALAATGPEARSAQMAARLRLLALGYESVLLENEKALRKWNALIATPLKQLTTYHAGGITKQQLTSLISNFLQLGVTGTILGTVQ